MKNITRFLFTFFLLLPGAFCEAQEIDSVVVIDNESVESREFSNEKLTEFQEDGDFDYAARNIPGKSLWQMFKEWITQILRKIFSFQVGQVSVGKILVYTVCILGFCYALYKLLETRFGSVFSKGSEKPLDYQVSDENIHELDFESLIKEATDQKQYRRGIRLTYLYALKKLADAQLIDWIPGKTNHEYLAELDNNELKPGFSTLGYYFEYAWYGDFEINESQYKKVSDTFLSWKKQIQS